MLVICYSSCVKDIGPLPVAVPPVTQSFCDSLNATFSGDVQPMLNANCALPGCHVSGGAPGDFTGYAGFKAKVDDGTVQLRVITFKDMPPAGPLPDSTLQMLNCWLNAGALNN